MRTPHHPARACHALWLFLAFALPAQASELTPGAPASAPPVAPVAPPRPAPFVPDTSPAQAAHEVCSQLPEPQWPQGVVGDAEYEAFITLREGRAVAITTRVIRGVGDRRLQRELMMRMDHANRGLVCEGFTGRVSRRFALPKAAP